jgi:MFS family permease
VLFADTGLSAAEISSLFVVWSLTCVLLEVPTGVVADLVSRRRLLLLSSLAYGATFAVWATFPSYPAFAVGFVLWGASGAVASGTFQAYVHDTLATHGKVRSYQRVVARGRAFALILNLLATVLAAPLLHLGGYALVAVVSVASCLAQAAVALSLPPDRRPVGSSGAGDRAAHRPGYIATLVAGLSEARSVGPVRHAVLMAALLAGVLAFDEYFPLLAQDLGTPLTVIPLLLGFTVAVQALGALAGDRAGPDTVPAALVVGGVLMAGGALSGHVAGFVALAVGYGVAELATVVVETRLQSVIEGHARATVTSVAGLFSDGLALVAFTVVAVGTAWWPLIAVFSAVAACLLPLAALGRHWQRA